MDVAIQWRYAYSTQATHQYHAGKGEENAHGGNSPHKPHFSCTHVLQLAIVLKCNSVTHAAL